MKNLKGSNQYKTKHKYKFWSSVIIILIICLVVALAGYFLKSKKLISPIPDGYISERLQIVKVVVAAENVDTYIDRYSKRYSTSDSQYTYLKQLLHCLVFRESRYGINKTNGDNGLAGGISQFHEATWIRMRKQMLKQGLIEEIGSRYNDEMAINTTVWAIVNGRKNEWGPILRGECK